MRTASNNRFGPVPSVVMIRRLITVVAMAIVVASCGGDEPVSAPFEVDPLAAQPISQTSALGASVAEITLPDVANAGQPFAMRADPGEVLVVYFGFTACPDICPTTLADLRDALSAMGEDAARIDVAMVTIDPERDTDVTIEAYLRSFVPDGIPLRTNDSGELDVVADAFGADFDVIKSADGAVEVYHTAYLYAIDDEGVIEVIWPFGAEPEVIAADLTQLLEQA